MPYHIKKESSGYFVVKEDGKKMNEEPHKTRAKALAHMRALYAAEDRSKADSHRLKKKKK